MVVLMLDFLGMEVGPVFWTAGFVLLLLGALQLYLGLRAQKLPKATGEQAMIGETGVVLRSSGYRERMVVEIRGELWWCERSDRGLDFSPGTEVEVTGLREGTMVLVVRPTGG